MKAEEECTHFCDDQKNKCFVMYNLKDKTTHKFEVPYETVYLFDSVQVANQIYFTGGGMPPVESKGEQFFQTAVRLTILPDFDTKIEKLPNMSVSRANHTMVALSPNKLYVVGGCNTKAEIPVCEEFTVDKKHWRDCAFLNEKKMWVSVCPVDGRYLYAFGGLTNMKPKESNLIECLDTTDLTAKFWTKIELAAGKDVWPRCFFVGCLQTAPDSVILFGGLINQTDQVEVDDTYVFNPKAKTMAKGTKLVRHDAFYRTKPAMSGNELMVVGSSEGDMHIYNIAEKKWTLIKKSMWNPEIGFAIKSDTF